MFLDDIVVIFEERQLPHGFLVTSTQTTSGCGSSTQTKQVLTTTGED